MNHSELYKNRVTTVFAVQAKRSAWLTNKLHNIIHPMAALRSSHFLLDKTIFIVYALGIAPIPTA